MPYIKQDRRGAIWHGGSVPTTAGELNYLISMYTLQHIDRLGRDQDLVDAILHAAKRYIESKGGLSYALANDVMGVLACASRELLRRTGRYGAVACILVAAATEFYNTIVAPYEDVKVKENGDMPYPPALMPERGGL